MTTQLEVLYLGEEPSYQVDYSHVGDQPLEDETLYKITYKFHQDKKVEGYSQFAGLTKDKMKQMWNCRPLGRWHLIGEGSGVAVAAAK